MNEQNLFFRWLYRMLAVGALFLLLAIAYLWVQSMLSSRQWRARDTVEVQQPGQQGRKQVQTLRFGELESISGTDIKMLKVESEDARGNSVGFSSGGYGAAFTIRNLVFLEAGNGKARWLFDDNEQFIGKVSKLCVCDAGREGSTLAIYLEVVRGKPPADARKDGNVQAALTRPDGLGYTEIGKPVSRVLDTLVSPDAKTIGLLVEERGNVSYRVFSLETFAPVSERAVTQLQR